MIKYVPIIFPTAGEYWISNDFSGSGNVMIPPKRQLIKLPDHYDLQIDKEVIKRVMDKYKLSSPVKLMATKDVYRRRNQLVSCGVRPSCYPAQAFVELKSPEDMASDNCRILMASPELCFLQAAAKLSFFELIKFGYDLCSIFLLDENAEHRQTGRTPAVNTGMIGDFLRQLSGVYGLSAAKNALRYIKDRSNSPVETRIAMLEMLPFSLGGFSVNGQELNADITLSEEAKAICNKKIICVDALWRKEKVVLEYDSNETHLSIEQHDRDKRRIMALETDGYKVLTITANMMSTNDDINNTFVLLRRMLGKRTDMRRIEETQEERKELLKFLRSF